MSPWSIKSKTVKDKIVAKEPKFQNNIDIVQLIKLNFLPVIFIVYSIVVLLIVILFMS